jgi:hypothetical protein
MFSVNMLKVLRLPSLKICTCLLSALFFYDIFFVFITPLFMKDGKSVMVEVRGGNSFASHIVTFVWSINTVPYTTPPPPSGKANLIKYLGTRCRTLHYPLFFHYFIFSFLLLFIS